MGIHNRTLLIFLLSLSTLVSCKKEVKQTALEKPTICLLGGTPSTTDILNQIPDSLKKHYNFIAFNRPGFGGTEVSKMSKEKLYQLAKEAGLRQNDFGIIGISGGAPLAILLAEEFNIKHCGAICGMVSNEAYFKYADSTFTKDFFLPATQSFERFQETVSGFPNLNDIIAQAGAETKEEAILASYNELNFILSKNLHSTNDKSLSIDWWHGEHDKNVAIESVEMFLRDYANSNLNIIPNTDHNIDAKVYIEKLVKDWGIQ